MIPANIALIKTVGEVGISFDDKEKWQKNLIVNYLDNLNKNTFPIIPRVPSARDIVFSEKLAAIVH